MMKVEMLRRFFASGCLLAAFLSSFGCSSAPDVRQGSSAIIRGADSDASQNEVILLVSVDNGFGACTGTLIAPNLVLTARHCVSSTQDTPFACDVNGNLVGYSGTQVGSDHPANTLLVFIGEARPMFGGNVMVAGRGKKIFHDGAKVLCSHDLALVLLENDIPGADIAPIRLDDPPVVGETFTAVGWGVTENGNPTIRQQRANVKVLKVGPDSTGEPTPPNDFKVGESICAGDSGGPALATNTNAVIGVVSRGGNGTNDPNNPAAGCINATNFYTSTSAFKDLILQAFAESGHEPWIEGQPDPRLAKFGEACTQDGDCQSGICVTYKGASSCSSDCSADPSVCPASYDCKTDDQGRSVCLPHEDPPPKPMPVAGGCSASSGKASTTPWLLLGVLTLFGRRRREPPSA
jgi:MYXO-CTERM domain-containing protein